MMQPSALLPLKVSCFTAVILLLLLSVGIAAPTNAQRLLADGLKDLADQITIKTRQQKAMRLAVLPFYQIDGKQSVLGPYLAEELFSHLVNSNLEIVERSLLDQALGEIEFDQSGAITSETAKKLGTFLGADAIVSGSITELQSQIAINCRLFDARSGLVFGAAQAKVVKDADVETLLKTTHSNLKPESPSRTPQPGENSAAASPEKIITAEVGGVIFDMQPCKVTGNKAKCEFKVRTEGPDKDLLRCWPDGSSLVDDDGNEVRGTTIVIGKSGGFVADSKLVSGVPVRGNIEFDGIRPKASKASLLTIQCAGSDVQFRDVPFVR